MAIIESEVSAPEAACTRAVDRLLARHKWRIVDRDELVRRTCAQVVDGPTADPGRAAIYVYSQSLHAACSGVEGDERQNAAYAELFHYLFDIARWRYADVCEDAAQRAIEGTWLNFAHCRHPGAFLAFAIQNLMDAARACRRFAFRPTVSLDAATGTNDVTLGERLPDERQSDPAVEIVKHEQRQRLERCLAEFSRKHPRASQQLAALRLKYIDGLDETTISRILGKSIQSIYVLRSRAIDKLSQDPSWRAIAREFGILSDEG